MPVSAILLNYLECLENIVGRLCVFALKAWVGEMSIYQINVFTQRIVNLFLQNLFSRPRGIPVYLFIAFCGPLLAPSVINKS